jgi:hypothetical protein
MKRVRAANEEFIAAFPVLSIYAQFTDLIKLARVSGYNLMKAVAVQRQEFQSLSSAANTDPLD